MEPEDWTDTTSAEMERMEYGDNACRLAQINTPTEFNPAGDYDYDTEE